MKLKSIIALATLLQSVICLTILTGNASAQITTRSQCLQYIKEHRPVCIRNVVPYEVCVCGTDEYDFQANIRTEPQPEPEPLDYSGCIEDPETGILYCPNSIFDE